MAKVQEYDASFGYLGQAWLDFPLDRPNKGLEGLTCVRRDGQTYLLGLCEGNRCRGGDEGRVPGGGRVHVFRRGRRHWERVGRIRLPETVLFEDYSGIAVAGDRIAVISQVSSALWLGNLAPSGWQVTGPGTCYALPEGCRRRDRLRDGRRGVMDGTRPAGHGLGQGQAGAGPPVPGQGPVHPHLPHPGPGLSRSLDFRRFRGWQPWREPMRACPGAPGSGASGAEARRPIARQATGPSVSRTSGVRPRGAGSGWQDT